MSGRLRSLVELGALGCGILLAAVALLSWSVAGGSERPGAEVSVYVDPSPTLALQPSGLLFSRSRLVPATRGPERRFDARNATGAPLRVRVRVVTDTRDLDRVLTVQVLAGRSTLFQGPLGLLRAHGSSAFVLRSRATRRLTVRTWIRPGVRNGYEARAATVHVVLATKELAA